MRIKLTVEYDGTNYCGWQKQKNGVSVQEILETAIYNVSGEKVGITGSGRTDAGVHARGQVCHFETTAKIPPQKWSKAINTNLNEQIRVVKSELAPEEFHARYSAKRKTYSYRMYISDVERPLFERYAVRIDEVNLSAMRECAEVIVGEHDFKCFLSSGSSVKNTVRTVYGCTIEREKEFVVLTVSGNGFLYNMVRIICGTLIAVGKGKLKTEAVAAALISGDRKAVGKTMPAKGLTLESVEYEK